jgi:hypothetical protein
MYKALFYGALLSLGPLISWAHGADAAAGDNAAATAPSTTPQSASAAQADLRPATETTNHPHVANLKAQANKVREAAPLKSLPAKAAMAATTSANKVHFASTRAYNAVKAHGCEHKCRNVRPLFKGFKQRCHCCV